MCSRSTHESKNVCTYLYSRYAGVPGQPSSGARTLPQASVATGGPNSYVWQRFFLAAQIRRPKKPFTARRNFIPQSSLLSDSSASCLCEVQKPLLSDLISGEIELAGEACGFKRLHERGDVPVSHICSRCTLANRKKTEIKQEVNETARSSVWCASMTIEEIM